MSTRSKIYSSFDDAVRDIPDGATLGFGGFAVVGMPINLYQAVAKQGAKNLTCVSNSTRGGATLPADAPDMGQMIQNGQGMAHERLDDIRVVSDHGNADDFHCPRHRAESIEFPADTQCEVESPI